MSKVWLLDLSVQEPRLDATQLADRIVNHVNEGKPEREHMQPPAKSSVNYWRQSGRSSMHGILARGVTHCPLKDNAKMHQIKYQRLLILCTC